MKLVFDELKNTSSRKEKEQILLQNKEDELFKEVLQFVYDDFVTTGLGDKSFKAKMPDELVMPSGINFDLSRLMEYVKENNTGTLNTVKLIQTYMEMFEDEEVQQFIQDIFTNNLKVGITAKTINKVFGQGFIKTFGCQLAYPYAKYPNKIGNGEEFIVTQKLDGHRSVCIVENQEANFFTRKGLPILGLDKQKEEALELVHYGLKVDDYVLDGELLLKNFDGLETKDLFRQTSKVLRSEKADKSNIIYNVFDGLPVQEFYQGQSTEVFSVRKDKLVNAMYNVVPLQSLKAPINKEELERNFRRVQVLEDLYEGDEAGVIYGLQKEYVDQLGWEGLMINLSNGLYVTKRTNDLLKVKEFFNADVVVTDVFKGTGKYEGTLGGIVIDYKGYPVNVGSGFDDNERDYYWKNPEEIIGKVVDIQYFEETNNQNNDDINLRFPTFKSVRRDKTPADVSYEI